MICSDRIVEVFKCIFHLFEMIIRDGSVRIQDRFIELECKAIAK